MPLDDTIPQNTEGDQYMSLAITPKSATNNLRIDVVIFLSSSSANTVTAALFQDSTANAIAAGPCYFPANGKMFEISFSHSMAAGTTSATTFKVRAGDSGASTVTFNGAAGSRLLGGVIASSITIIEYT
jgi:hypothetical protein